LVRGAQLAVARAELITRPARRIRPTWLDAAILLALLAAVVFVAVRVETVLVYRWNWAPIPNYLLRWDEVGGLVPNLLLQGLATTLRLSLWGMALAAALGVFVAMARISRLLFLRLCGRAYIELMRNTPPLVLIFVGYFFVASQIMPFLPIDALARTLPEFLIGDPRLLRNFLAALIVLAMFESAYIAEILRAGIESIERGQWDAGAALGLTRIGVLRRVILPQAISRMIPPLCGQFISLVKDSSIVSLVSVQDLTFMANDVAVSSQRVFETWLTTAAIYFAVCFTLSRIFARWEAKLSAHLKR
jgi:polar amino acid transport system permease protein